MVDKTEYQIATLMKYNRDGTPDAQSKRYKTLISAFQHLQEKRGYSKRFDLKNFSRKEMNRLVHDWKQQGIKHATIMNKVADLRWLDSKVGQGNAVPATNRELGLGSFAARGQKSL